MLIFRQVKKKLLEKMKKINMLWFVWDKTLKNFLLPIYCSNFEYFFLRGFFICHIQSENEKFNLSFVFSIVQLTVHYIVRVRVGFPITLMNTFLFYFFFFLHFFPFFVSQQCRFFFHTIHSHLFSAFARHIFFPSVWASSIESTCSFSLRFFFLYANNFCDACE